MNKEELCQLFKQKAEAVQVVVTEAEDLDQALGYAVVLTKEQQGSTIAAPGLGEPERSRLAELCGPDGPTLVLENLRQREFHTGLTWTEWGVAESGSLVLPWIDEDVRLSSMLAETHVALLPKQRIRLGLASLEDEFTRLLKSPPGYLAVITGASRTADIESVLTLGVHGPKELHVVLLESER